MKSILTIAALGGFAYGLRHFVKFLNQREKSRIQEKRLEVWEGEGGAVPVAATRTAAQVSAKKSSSASGAGVAR
jgi:hypothetical protein